jgi:hypothetical protein
MLSQPLILEALLIVYLYSFVQWIFIFLPIPIHVAAAVGLVAESRHNWPLAIFSVSRDLQTCKCIVPKMSTMQYHMQHTFRSHQHPSLGAFGERPKKCRERMTAAYPYREPAAQCFLAQIRLIACSGGHEMHCVGTFFTDTKRNIEHLHRDPPFEFMLRDVTFPPYVEVDEIYNPERPAIHRQTEDYWENVNSIGPRSCYDEGKRCAEI